MNASSLVSDDLWEAIEPLLPKEPPKPKGGRPRVPDRAALGGIIFVLRTGCPWRLVPQALGCGSGTTCWRRVREWHAAGVWQRLHETLLNWLGDEAAIDWSRASVDSLSVRAKRGASKPAPTQPTVVSPAPNITSWSIGTVSRSRCASQPPTPTIPPNSFRSSMPSRPSSAHEGNQDDRASVRPSSTPTRRTTPHPCVVPSELVASRHGLLAAASTLASDSGGTAGWSNARLPGCSATAAWASAMSGAPICSRGCSTWPVR
jgi:transposase